MQINCEGEYLQKATELDRFFMNAFYENKWGLAHKIPKSSIEGYDEHGQGDLWKRICKDPYSKYKRKTFDKGYTPNWTEEVFLIDEIRPTDPITYKIKDLNGEEIKGSFYREELQKTD